MHQMDLEIYISCFSIVYTSLSVENEIITFCYGLNLHFICCSVIVSLKET